MTNIAIKHAHGQTERADNLDAALAKLRSVYGDAIETEGDFPGRVLVWRDAAAALNDDGARAVAVLSELQP